MAKFIFRRSSLFSVNVEEIATGATIRKMKEESASRIISDLCLSNFLIRATSEVFWTLNCWQVQWSFLNPELQCTHQGQLGRPRRGVDTQQGPTLTSKLTMACSMAERKEAAGRNSPWRKKDELAMATTRDSRKGKSRSLASQGSWGAAEKRREVRAGVAWQRDMGKLRGVAGEWASEHGQGGGRGRYCGLCREKTVLFIYLFAKFTLRHPFPDGGSTTL